VTETTDIRRRVMPRRQLLRKFLNGEELPERERARAEKIMSDLEGPGSVGLPGPQVDDDPTLHWLVRFIMNERRRQGIGEETFSRGMGYAGRAWLNFEIGRSTRIDLPKLDKALAMLGYRLSVEPLEIEGMVHGE